MPPKGKYSDPKLRDEVKEDVQNSDKGGVPGQWSARKAQFMASEYKKRGGGYTTDKETGQDESQQHLSKWSEEEWQTKEGSGTAKNEDGTRERYLPKKAWEQMDDKEKEETNEKKQDASKDGQQFVQNTGKAKQARGKANKEEAEKFDEKKRSQAKGKRGSKNQQQNGTAPRRSARGAKQDANDKNKAASKKGDADVEEESGDQEYEQPDGGKEDEEEFEDPPIDDDVAKEVPEAANDEAESRDNTMDSNIEAPAKTGQKRGRGGKQNGGEASSKKQKGNTGKPHGTIGSKHDSAEEPAPAASNDRLPKKGQRVSWKALPGWVHGEMVEVLTANKEINGKTTKASKSDPRLVVKSDNGKTAVHKPDKVHFAD